MYTTTNIFRHISEFCWSTQEKRTHHTATQNEAAKTRKMWNFHEFSFSFAQINIFSQLSLSLTVLCSAFGVEFLPPFFFFIAPQNILFWLFGHAFFFFPLTTFFISSNNMIYDRRRAKMIQNSPRKRTFRVLSFHVCWLLLFFAGYREEKKGSESSPEKFMVKRAQKSNFIRCCFIRKCLSSDSSEASIRFLSLFLLFCCWAVVTVVDPILTEIFFNFFKAE